METKLQDIKTVTMQIPEAEGNRLNERITAYVQPKRYKRGYRFYFPVRIPNGKGAYQTLQIPAVILKNESGFIKIAYYSETKKHEDEQIKYSLESCSHFFQNYDTRKREEYIEEVDDLLNLVP